MGTRKQPSALDSVELAKAYHALHEWRSSLDVFSDQGEETADVKSVNDIEKIDKMLELMRERMRLEKILGFSDFTHSYLDTINVSEGGILTDKNDTVQNMLVEQSSVSAQDHLMSSERVYQKLEFLSEHVLKTSEASARLWIDTFLFRAAAMLSSSTTRVLLHLEYSRPQGVSEDPRRMSITGQTNYVVLRVSPATANALHNTGFSISSVSNPALRLSGLFVAEAKSHSTMLANDVPQTVAEMHACAKMLKKDTIRGALTDGITWIFIIHCLKTDGSPGGSYWAANPIKLHLDVPQYRRELGKRSADTIAGILAYWIEHCHDDIADDEWFKKVSSAED